MSKKDKKRIAELERQQSILLATMRVLRKDFNTLSLSIVHDKIEAARAANSFQAGTIPSEKEQENPTDYGANRCGIFCHHELPKTEQAQQSEAEKERELMGKVNAELAKFASLEVFNADRKNFFLPPIGKLEFDKMKAAIECTIAIAKMVRPDYFDQIDQIKIPQTEQDKPEQSQPEKSSENLDKPVLNKPNQFKKGQFRTINPEEREENIAKEDWESRKQISAEQLDASLSKLASLPLKSEQELAEAKRTEYINLALKKLVDELTKHHNFILNDYAKDRAKQIEMLQIYCDNFKEDLADFRRKVLSVSELVEAKQSEPILPAPEQKEAEKSGSELGETWLIYDKIDKAWAAKCSEGGFYWSSRQDDFVLNFPSEAEANRRFNALCSRGIISVMHRANSVVIRKE